MQYGAYQEKAKRLLWVIPALLVAGLLVGLAALVVELAQNGDIGHGLWRTVLATITTILNHCVYGGFSLGVFIVLLASAQIASGRDLAPSLRAAIGFQLFYPIFMTIVWLVTDLAVSAFHLEAHKLPEVIRQNEELSLFLLDNYLAQLDIAALGQNLIVKAGWLWPSFLPAAVFGVWFERAWTALVAWRRKRAPAGDSPSSRSPVWAVATVSTLAAVLLLLNMANLYAKLTTRQPQPNVILISLDTVRADHLGCYGDQHAQTPVLDRLATNGVLFEEAISNSSWTLPGHGGMLTGVQPTALGLFKVTDRLDAKALTMAEVFHEHGFDTGAIASYILLDKVYGFDQGFEYFDYVDHQPAAQVVDKAIAYVSQRQQQKFFLFLHLYDAHWPYEPELSTARRFWPHGVGTELHDLLDTGDYARFALKVLRGPRLFNDYCLAMYNGELHDVDKQLGRLFKFLLKQGLDNRTVIVVTSDHGEEFLEHGLFGHGLTLYDESLHVPLIMRFPHLLPSGVRVKGQVQLLDLFPTLLGLTGIDASVYDHGGRDLTFAAAAGEVNPVPVVAETNMSGERRYALRTGVHKFLTPVNLDFGNGLTVERGEEVYDLASDPAEERNLVSTHPKMLDILKQQLAEQLSIIESRWGMGEAFSRSEELSAEEIERLRSLGYIN